MHLAEIVRQFKIGVRVSDVRGDGVQPHAAASAEIDGEVAGRATAWHQAEAKAMAVLGATVSGVVAERLARDELEEAEEARESFASSDPSARPSMVAKWRIIQSRAAEYAGLLAMAAKRSIKSDRTPGLCLDDGERARLVEVATACGQRGEGIDADLLGVRDCLEAERQAKAAAENAATFRAPDVVSKDLNEARLLIERLEIELRSSRDAAGALNGARSGLSEARSRLSLPALLGFNQPLAIVPAK